jgi:hypothetical protein
MYTPDGWVVLKITHNDKTFYKLFGAWRGGYLDGDHWRINSGITSVESDDNFYYFYGQSGSIYRVAKETYGYLGNYNSGILARFVENGAEAMHRDTNWLEVKYD